MDINNYQRLELGFLMVFIICFSIIGIFRNKKYSLKTLIFSYLSSGVVITVISALISIFYIKGSIYNFLLFKEYYFTLGFAKYYMLGGSILLSIPIIVFFELVKYFIKK
ncbi:MAG: hypothetical protein WC748_10870 [Legionellales bacterium]|jgi:hypothetical protein